MYLSFLFLDQFLFELLCKNTYTHTHRDSDEYSIVGFCKNVTIQKYKNNGIIKQIITGLEGNRLSIWPLRFKIISPKISIDHDCASVNRNSW